MQDQTKLLFQMSNELIEMKVEHAVSKSITQVVDQIVNLRQEMQRDMSDLRNEIQRVDSNLRQEMQQEIGSLRQEMQQDIGSLRQEMHQEIGGLKTDVNNLKHDVGQRLSAVETALGMRQQHRKEIRSRFYDYVFQASWLVLGALLTYAAIHFHVIFQ